MKTLSLINERSGQQIGQIVLSDSGVVDTTGNAAAGIFRQHKRRLGGTDAKVFDVLATGWSNGYVTIRLVPSAAG